MVDTFIFAPDRNVPETLPREAATAMSFNGWSFTARPTTPYQRKFKITLHGMRWYTNPTTGLWDTATNPNFNARLLEMFYEAHETWDPFTFNHQHFGPLLVRFANAVTVPKGRENSGGFIDAFEIQLIHHNPGY